MYLIAFAANLTKTSLSCQALQLLQSQSTSYSSSNASISISKLCATPKKGTKCTPTPTLVGHWINLLAVPSHHLFQPRFTLTPGMRYLSKARKQVHGRTLTLQYFK